MKYKINFRNLVAAHVLIGVLLVVALFIVDSNKAMLRGILAGVGFSLLLQVLVYRFRPTWFDEKKTPGS